ncbi:alkene reductase [Mariprofundus erugo]|uniref:Alkene reductase n=1 Tax=Mariprofundus erugo TaxID=2528639 RepID=A0A5R9GTV0_9PROT|nr:alkene reductase [Mariprofundus erugo]TLS68299.1 alkene reductase [Mariprofundus erugo]TLS77154.1 alkene reductase [Mariprofundus erugo]
MTNLFSNFPLGEHTLGNRMVMAPMTRNRAPATIPTALMSEYYTQRAGAGLIITEGAQISEQAVGYPATPGIYLDSQVAGWRTITDAVHAKGSHIFVQLWHCGRISHPVFHGGELPVAPSAIKPAGQAFTAEGLKDFVTPRALTEQEIPGIIEQYRHAAAMAVDAGFDGVEIHAANGYLLDQFLRDGSNKRQDIYGGSIENRARLLLEVTKAVCDEIGAGKVGIRISPVNGFNDMQDSDPQALFNHVASALSALQPAYLHMVEVTMTGDSDQRVDMQEIRRHFAGCYIANGGYDKQRGDHAIATGQADLIAYGIPFLANPDLPERFRQDAPLNPVDQTTLYGGDAHGYTDYPALESQPA